MHTLREFRLRFRLFLFGDSVNAVLTIIIVIVCAVRIESITGVVW